MFDRLSNKIPTSIWVGFLFICLMPVVLNLIGVDFGTVKSPINLQAVTTMSKLELANSFFMAIMGGIVHALMEWTNVTVAVVGVLGGVVVYFNTRRLSVLIFSIALAAAGVIDAYHTMIAARIVEVESALPIAIPFSWALCRIFNAVILLAAGLCFLVQDEQQLKDHKIIISIFVVFSVVAAGIIIIYLTIGDLPQAGFQDSLFARPYDIVSMVIYLVLALVVFPKLFSQIATPFMAMIILSLVPHIIAQIYMAFFSTAVFDNAFHVGHFMKLIAYVAPLIGIFLEIRNAYKHQIQLQLDVERAAKEVEYNMKAAKTAHTVLAEAEVSRKSEIDILSKEFKSGIEDILQSTQVGSHKLGEVAQTLVKAANDGKGYSDRVSKISMDTANNVSTVATASEELSVSVNEIIRQVQATSQVIDTAAEKSADTNQRVSSLSEAALSVGDVVKLIADIAEQTNLLALNATIEAARAGESGKGFAVVAQEVKNLASQTTNATEEISSRIGGIQSETRIATKNINEINDFISKVSENVEGIVAAVQQQSMSTAEIAQNIQNVAEGASVISSSSQQVTVAAGDTGQQAEGVVATASDLEHDVKARIDVLKGKVAVFMKNIDDIDKDLSRKLA